MADTRCVAIKSSDGERCTKRSTIDGRCRSHNEIRTREGPNVTELTEIRYAHKLTVKISQSITKAELAQLGPDPWRNHREAYNDILRAESLRNREQRQEYLTRLNATRERQLADIARTGIDPDAVQNAARAARAAERERQNAERMAQIAGWRAQEAQRVQNLQQLNAAQRVQNLQQRNAVQQAARVDARPLAAFANDRQNVHTTSAVKQTLTVIKEILKIEVPVEYRWNMNVISKTISEIIAECSLTPAAAWQMMAKYCSDDTIYDLESGIYGKVLDCVWQYIKNSPDKEDLKKILKSEMRDNIGMCAQGNLSRLTNILAGYVDCVVVEESIADKLGRLLPPLMEIEDIVQRLNAAARIFVANNVPEDQWNAWAGGLISDQADDDYREMFIHDGVIDLVAFN